MIKSLLLEKHCLAIFLLKKYRLEAGLFEEQFFQREIQNKTFSLFRLVLKWVTILTFQTLNDKQGA